MTDEDDTGARGGLTPQPRPRSETDGSTPPLGIDLAAWETPDAPSGIADAVVARMREPIAAAARDVDARRRRWSWWAVGAALVGATAFASIAAFKLVTNGGGPTSGSGAVATAKPSHLELGDSAADLEANTDVRWARDGHRVVAAQPRGAATWKVDGKDKLVIDAGATVASVEASGASLRVEVQMNLSEARAIGVSAMTAAAVAMVTVVVYEGHVDVTGNGHTVTVPAGGTIEIAPGKEPAAPDLVGRTERERKEAEIRALEAQIKELQTQQEQLLNSDRPGGIVVDKLDPADIQRIAGAQADRCKRFPGKYTVTLTIAAAGGVTDASVTSDGVGVADVAGKSCLAGATRDAKFAASRNGGTYRFTVVVDRGCDVAEAVKRGDEAVANGNHSTAVSAYKQALKCRGDGAVLQKAYMAACNARLAGDAKGLFAMLPPGKQNYFAQACLRYGIDPTGGAPATVSSCDFDEAVRRGDRNVSAGNHASALAAYKEALACHTDGSVLQKAFLAACNAKSTSDARSLLSNLPSDKQKYFAQACLRYGIDPTVGPGTACDAGKLAKQAENHAANGRHVAALASYDLSLQCKFDAGVLEKAFLSACNTRNTTKAKEYFGKLPAGQQNTFAAVCIRYGVDPNPSGAGASTTCDADKLAEQGDAAAASADHAKALGFYERALACRFESALLQKTFLAACNSKNEPKAALYFPKLPAAKQNYYSQACLRYGIDPTKGGSTPAPVKSGCQLPDQVDPFDARPICSQVGVLRVTSSPYAYVYVDGDKAHKKETPTTFELKPGNHKCTFMLDNKDRFTFPVTIKAGEVTTLSKDLE